jgi:hypothetical protein
LKSISASEFRLAEFQILAYAFGYRQSADTNPKPNSRIITPLITTPAIAAIRFAFLIQATMLTISASGGVKNRTSPPRAVRGERHPGCSSTISMIVTGATSDNPRPSRPPVGADSGSGWSSLGGMGRTVAMQISFPRFRRVSMDLVATAPLLTATGATIILLPLIPI